MIPTTVVPEPPTELVSFVERHIRSARPYAGLERRSDKRCLMAIPVLAQPLDEESNAVGAPFAAMTRDISPKGIGLIHTAPIEHKLLAIRMSLGGKEVDLVAAILWCRTLGPYYYVGANFVSEAGGSPEVAIPELESAT